MRPWVGLQAAWASVRGWFLEEEEQSKQIPEKEPVLEDQDESEDEFGYAPPADRKLRVNGRVFSKFRRLAEGRQRASLLCLPVADPAGRFAFFWALFTTLVDLTYTAFVVPISIAFTRTDWRKQGDSVPALSVIDLSGNIVYILDLLVGFHIGFIVLWDARWVTIVDGRRVAKYYIRHGQFAINVIAIVPLFLQIVMTAAGDINSHALHLIYMLRLLRLTRVVSLIQGLSNPGEKGSITRLLQGYMASTYMLIFNALFSLLVLLNLLGCVWWMIAMMEGIEESWAGHISGKMSDLRDADDPTRWLYSVYFTMTTITTIGYGDIVPYTNVEIGVSLLYMLIGVAYFGYLINVVAQLISSAQPSKAAAALHEQMQALDGWMSLRRLPRQLQRRLRTYFLRRWIHQTESEEVRYYTQLPPDLRTAVQAQLQTQDLSKCSLFLELPEQAHARLISVIKVFSVPVNVYPGHMLYSKGEAAHYFYILDDGTMAASSVHPGWPPSHFSGPAVVGALAIFAPQVQECGMHQQSMTAVTGCHLWRVECAAVHNKLLERHADVLKELAQVYVERIRGLLQQTKAQGWGGPQSIARQRRAQDRLEKLAQALDSLAASLAAAAAEQEKQREEEEAAKQRVAEQALARASAAALARASAASGSGESPAPSDLAQRSSAYATGSASSPAGRVPGDRASMASTALTSAATDTYIQLAEAGGVRVQVKPRRGLSVLSESGRQLVGQLELHDVLLGREGEWEPEAAARGPWGGKGACWGCGGGSGAGADG